MLSEHWRDKWSSFNCERVLVYLLLICSCLATTWEPCGRLDYWRRQYGRQVSSPSWWRTTDQLMVYQLAAVPRGGLYWMENCIQPGLTKWTVCCPSLTLTVHRILRWLHCTVSLHHGFQSHSFSCVFIILSFRPCFCDFIIWMHVFFWQVLFLCDNTDQLSPIWSSDENYKREKLQIF